MTKLKTAAITCLTVSGLAGFSLAQDALPTSAFPATTGTTSATSAGAVAAPRTGLYTVVTKGNAAADNTVDDYSRRPTLIGDRQYFAGYGGADLQSAAFSFDGKGLNWFGSVLGGAGTDPDLLRFGVGSDSRWGGGVLLAVNHTDVTNAAGDITTTYEGTGLGVFGDLSLGSSDVYGQVGWFTGYPGNFSTPPFNSVTNSPNAGPETEESNWNLNVMGGWKKDATGEGTHALNAELSYTLGNSESDVPDEDNSVSLVVLSLSHGYILKSASDYAVFLGCNGGLLWQADNDDVANTDGTHFGIFASPNLAFQKQLGRGFEGFAGASVTGSFDSYSEEPIPASVGAPVGTTDANQFLTGSADVAVGLRWVKDNFALEGSLKETVLQNGPYFVGGNADQGLFINVGLALGI